MLIPLEPPDAAGAREATAGPGGDTRSWISYGRVMDDTDDARSVRYHDEDGQRLPHGVLVDVELLPSGLPVSCRIGLQSAGSGEGEHSPIGPGDEVLVAIPDGDERAGCVIIARFPNDRDEFPDTVAGIDTTNNSVRFWRGKVPYIIESGSAILLRNALTGSQLALAADGSVFLTSGDKHFLALNADVLMLQTGDGAASVQIDASAHTVALQADTTSLVIDPNSSAFATGGTLSIATSGMGATQHAITLEQMISLLINWTMLLVDPAVGSTTLSSELSGVAAVGKLLYTAPGDPPNDLHIFDAALAKMLTAMATPVPPAVGTGGGNLALFPLTFVSILAALEIPVTVPIFQPGVAKPGLLF